MWMRRKDGQDCNEEPIEEGFGLGLFRLDHHLERFGNHNFQGMRSLGKGCGRFLLICGCGFESRPQRCSIITLWRLRRVVIISLALLSWDVLGCALSTVIMEDGMVHDALDEGTEVRRVIVVAVRLVRKGHAESSHEVRGWRTFRLKVSCDLGLGPLESHDLGMVVQDATEFRWVGRLRWHFSSFTDATVEKCFRQPEAVVVLLFAFDFMPLQ
mmetsp:Transcript_5454/g.16052  ORF Transcript_5454/g.16052 Transcript_5454/m.16052 type:complete len:213 (-) Transcript_5454:727-1365(-)